MFYNRQLLFIIKANVFIGHGLMLINDKYPRATNEDGLPQTEKAWEFFRRCSAQKTIVA